MADDFDFVSDLNGTGETNVAPLDEIAGNHGADAVRVDRVDATREPAVTPKKVGNTETEGTDKPLSLRDQISSAIKGEELTPPAASQDGVARNADGTFATKPVVEPVVEPTAPVPPLPAPQGIDPQVFNSLPAETQAQLARTMEDVNTRQSQLARLDQVEQIIAPRRDLWAINGMTEAQALNQLLALSDFAGRDPSAFIKYMAEQNGVDLEELVLGQEPVDPVMKALQDRIAELEGTNTRAVQEQKNAAHQSTVNHVIAFASEKGADGNLLRPYYDELGNDVLPFISAVKTQNPNWSHNQVLQEAYDRACWGSPTVRGKMQAAANAVGEAERLRQQNEKVSQARTAGASVRSGTPAAAAPAPEDANRSLRDSIKAAIASTS